jgi:hypothetical protein
MHSVIGCCARCQFSDHRNAIRQHHNDSIRTPQKKHKTTSDHFNTAQILFLGRFLRCYIYAIFLTDIETLKAHSQSLNRPTDIETSAYKNRRASPKPVALLSNNRPLSG